VKIWISGSIAYDIILDYPGRFADHINLKNVHVLSLSFLLSRAEKTLGGTAANIAYNLAMLGAQVGLLGSVGKDGADLLARYKRMSIDIKLSRISKKHGTSTAYIMTDRDDNQIAGFYPGAMTEPTSLPKLDPCDWPVVSPESPKNMIRLARHYQSTKHRYVFDPGQQVIAFTSAQLRVCLRGASIVIGNDYETGYLFEKLKVSHLGAVVFRTLGPRGSEIIYPNGMRQKVGIVRPKSALDPTGAGDAYRAGLIKGVISGFDLKRSAQMGATAAAFAVETHGTQKHEFDYDILVRRYNRNFKEKI